jgi:hypothetical protein
MLARNHPLADVPREVAGFDDLERLIQRMAGEHEPPAPVHAVFAPPGGDR